MNKFVDKKGVIAEYLPWLLIAVAILAILMIAIFILKGKGFSLFKNYVIDFFKNIPTGMNVTESVKLILFSLK